MSTAGRTPNRAGADGGRHRLERRRGHELAQILLASFLPLATIRGMDDMRVKLATDPKHRRNFGKLLYLAAHEATPTWWPSGSPGASTQLCLRQRPDPADRQHGSICPRGNGPSVAGRAC